MNPTSTNRSHPTALSPVLIMGSPRSGTTFLGNMVNRFFDLRLSRDNGTLVRFYRLRRHYEPLTNDDNLRRLIKHLYADPYFQERLIARGLVLNQEQLFERVTDRTYGGLVDTIFSTIATQRGRSTWGYKRASLARMTGESVDGLFPRARFVHIIRDARDVVLSMGRAGGTLLERTWHFAGADWVEHVRKGREVARLIGPDRYFEIRYERLMTDPANALIDILDFCGGGFDRDARAERIRQEMPGLIKKGNTEKWRTQLPPEAIRQIERVAGPLLLDLGYPLTIPEIAGQPVPPMEMAMLRCKRTYYNIMGARMNNLFKYRLSVLRAMQRARFKSS
jgi:hypothetical protein